MVASSLLLPAGALSDWYLALGFLALCAGPLFVWLLRANAASTVALDAFCLITISGFALLHLLPESAQQAGWVVLPLALVGFVLPSIAERTLHHGHPGTRWTVILLAVFGIAAHATLDGLFLHAGAHAHDGHNHGGHTHELTAWAVILHRIPEGLGIWWIVPRTLGKRAAILITLASITATLFGYYLGDTLLSSTSQTGLALLQSLLAGSLLHVVLHAHIPAPRTGGRMMRVASVAGGAIAVTVLFFVIHIHPPEDGAGGHQLGPGSVFLRLLAESAPALLLAYLLVGLCQAFLPANWLSGVTKGPRLLQAVRGVAVGLPLPVCSCGVVPIYRQLVRQGASIAAAIAFLIATPELELAAVMLTWQLMGGEVALIRCAMAAVLALAVGMLVASLAQPRTDEVAADDPSLPEPPTGSVGSKLRAALSFGFGPAVDSTATWILVGLIFSSVLMPFLDQEWIASLPAGVDVPVAALIGLPLYVCATGSTPLAAILLVQGLSPGAVLALLLTGPATNMTTFGVLAKLHGKRTAVVFAIAMWLGAVGLGYATNLLLDRPDVGTFDAHQHMSRWSWLWIGALALVFGWSLFRQGVRPFLERLFESPVNAGHGGGCHDGHDHHHGHDHADPQDHCGASHGSAPDSESPPTTPHDRGH